MQDKKNKFIIIKRKCKNLAQFFIDCLKFFVFKRKAIPVRFYSQRRNVGDALNVFLISKISGREVFEIKSGLLPHILGVGSIMHLGTGKSVAWGTGIIEENRLPRLSTLKKIEFSALRGKKTREILCERLGETVDCPLGDPAVLMPLFYEPTTTKQYSVGIVPHYVDKEAEGFKRLLSKLKAKLIDVELPVGEFVDQLTQCEVILSSSLHGLILADAYQVPNLWVKFSDKIIGGSFKFEDYYSTTDTEDAYPVDLSSKEFDENFLEALVSQANISKYKEDKELLLNAFPSGL